MFQDFKILKQNENSKRLRFAALDFIDGGGFGCAALDSGGDVVVEFDARAVVLLMLYDGYGGRMAV